MAARIILSPHLDDAVFSCWHIITQPHTTVITIFAGQPLGGKSTIWDQLAGEADSAKMLQRRLQENELALKKTKTTQLNLNYCDYQYRQPRPSSLAISNDILARVDPRASFVAPLAGGGRWYRHPDHLLTRAVGLQLLSLGRQVSFYADVPYMSLPKHPTTNYRARAIKRANQLLQTKTALTIYELSASERQAKLAAMQQYGSQYRLINLISMGRLSRQAINREMFFATL